MNKNFVTQEVKDRTRQLMEKMTLDEKIGQLHQLGPTLSATLAGYTVNVDDLVTQMMEGKITKAELDEKLALCKEDIHEDLVREGRLGNFIGLYDADKIARVQHVARYESRLGIPLFIGVDIVRGYKTIFPDPVAMACSWNMESLRDFARIAAKEASAVGINWTFAPMLDIARDSRWGRIVEGAGEDPYLASCVAKALVSGFQNESLGDPDSLLACAKHFAAYGAASGGQDYNTVDMSLPMFYNTYLQPFKSAVEAGVGSVMSAFNDFNGVPCAMDSWLLTSVLRHELGFCGMVVSDADSVGQCVIHGAVKDGEDAAVQCISAGGDMDMASGCYSRFLKQAVDGERLDEAVIDRAVENVLHMKFLCGLFDMPEKTPQELAAAQQILLCDEHRAAARKAAGGSMVLLKNQGDLLPLSKNPGQVAVIGDLAVNKEEFMGPWSFTGSAADCVSVLEGIKEAVSENTKVVYAKGCDIDSEDESGFEQALLLAKDADVVVAVMGESSFMSGEAASRADTGLPGVQEKLLKALKSLGKPVILVLVAGRPMAISWAKSYLDAILMAWHPGTEGGHAIGDILFGDVNPSGRLTTTWSNAPGQEPMYYNHPNTGKPGGSFKFTSKYLDVPIEPMYPFGYGLSYTTYEYSHLEVEKDQVAADGTVRCHVTVKNTGKRSGFTVVQLYIRHLTAACVRPVRELKRFERVYLEPGQEKVCSFELPVSEFGYYNRNLKYTVEPGKYELYAGGDCTCSLQQTFDVKETL